MGEGRTCTAQLNARGAQENLWPKFILESAPLRATSSVLSYCKLRAVRNLFKIMDTGTLRPVGIAMPLERFTSIV